MMKVENLFRHFQELLMMLYTRTYLLQMLQFCLTEAAGLSLGLLYPAEKSQSQNLSKKLIFC